MEEILILDHKKNYKLFRNIVSLLIILGCVGCGGPYYGTAITFTEFFENKVIAIPIEGDMVYNGEYATTYLSNSSQKEFMKRIAERSSETKEYVIKDYGEKSFLIEISEGNEVYFAICSQRTQKSRSAEYLYMYDIFDVSTTISDLENDRQMDFIWAFPFVDDTIVYWDWVETDKEYVTKYELSDFKEYYQYIIDRKKLKCEIETGENFIIIPKELCKNEEGRMKIEFYSNGNANCFKISLIES